MPVERRRLTDDPEEHLAQKAQHDTDVPRQNPHVLSAVRATGSVPHGPAKVPKVHGRVVGDDEGLAVDALVVEGRDLQLGSLQKGDGGQQVAVRHVLDVGEVKEVVVVADLNRGLAVLVELDEVVQRHGVAFAHDARGTDGAGEQVGGGGGAVGLEDELFSGGLEKCGRLVSGEVSGSWRGVVRKKKKHLCLGVILALLSSADYGPALVGVNEIGLVVAHHTGGTGVDEGGNARLLARLDDGGSAVDVDLLEKRMGDAVVGLGGRRRGVDDDLRLDLVEDLFESGGVGDVGFEVLNTIRLGAPVARAAKVDDANGADVVAEEHADNVVAEEATAANHQDGAKLRFLF